MTAANLIYFLAFPCLLSWFYCRCSSVDFSPIFTVLYTAGFFGISSMNFLPEFLSPILGVCFLALCGVGIYKHPPSLAVSVSALVLSLFFLTVGFIQSAGFWLIERFWSPAQLMEWILEYGDIILLLLELLLLIGLFQIFLQPFSRISSYLGNTALLFLALPLLFIVFTENIVSKGIYGDTIVWDSVEGIVFPVVDSFSLFCLHLLGYLGMFAVLTAFQWLSQSIRKNQNLRQLEFQIEQQRSYLLEAQARYDKTRSLRHDIKNHLALLKGFLSKGETERAEEYLVSLGHAAEALSFPVHTNNPVADILLENKFLAAQQYRAAIECCLDISAQCPIQDMDWCIILANALDNALEEICSLPEAERFIRIYSRKKGDFFLLHIENGTHKDSVPVYGTGLSNMRAAIEKYEGTMEVSVKENIFTLDILFHFSQH